MPEIPDGSCFCLPELGNNCYFFSNHALAIGSRLDHLFVQAIGFDGFMIHLICASSLSYISLFFSFSYKRNTIFQCQQKRKQTGLLYNTQEITLITLSFVWRVWDQKMVVSTMDTYVYTCRVELLGKRINSSFRRICPNS